MRILSFKRKSVIIRDVGIIFSRDENMEYRIERDTLGEIKVPADKLWAAQTQRSKENFPIEQSKCRLKL